MFFSLSGFAFSAAAIRMIINGYKALNFLVDERKTSQKRKRD